MPNKRQHLLYEERFCIEKMLKVGNNLITIANTLERGLSTISQEISNNGGKLKYMAKNAQDSSNTKQNTKKQMYNKVIMNVKLSKFVKRKIKEGISPEAISILLNARQDLVQASPKSIRRYIKQKVAKKQILLGSN